MLRSPGGVHLETTPEHRDNPAAQVDELSQLRRLPPPLQHSNNATDQVPKEAVDERRALVRYLLHLDRVGRLHLRFVRAKQNELIELIELLGGLVVAHNHNPLPLPLSSSPLCKPSAKSTSQFLSRGLWPVRIYRALYFCLCLYLYLCLRFCLSSGRGKRLLPELIVARYASPVGEFRRDSTTTTAFRSFRKPPQKGSRRWFSLSLYCIPSNR